MKRQFFGALLALLVILSLLCACQRTEPEPDPTPTQVEPSPPATATPTPTPSPEPDPEPDPDPEPFFFNGLNGEPTEEDSNTLRPIAVMFNNISVAMPQCGSGGADILYEILAEGGVTRMMGIFSDISDAGALGSIRSSRPYYLDIARGYGAIYVHGGGSDDAYAYIANNKINNIDGVRGVKEANAFYRDSSRGSAGYEHTLFIKAGKVLDIIPVMGYETEHEDGSFDYGLRFCEDAAPCDGSAADNIVITFNTGKKTTCIFHDDSEDYTLRQYGTDFIDGNTKKVQRFENILILYAEHVTLDNVGRLSVKLVGDGKGYFINGGFYEEINWKRDAEGTPFEYLRDDGSTLELGIGRTYIAIIPINGAVAFS